MTVLRLEQWWTKRCSSPLIKAHNLPKCSKSTINLREPAATWLSLTSTAQKAWIRTQMILIRKAPIWKWAPWILLFWNSIKIRKIKMNQTARLRDMRPTKLKMTNKWTIYKDLSYLYQQIKIQLLKRHPQKLIIWQALCWKLRRRM